MKRPLLILAILAVPMGCAAFNIGGGRRDARPAGPPAGTSTSAPIESVNQEALLAAYAKLEAEVAGLKAGRDITGLAYNSEFGVGVAVTLCLWALLDWAEDMFTAWCLHRQKMAGKG